MIELIENFCCVQLSVNIQKAFFDGVKSSTADLICDVLVHKLVRYLKKKHGGRHGAPEYAHSAVAFPKFLELKRSFVL